MLFDYTSTYGSTREAMKAAKAMVRAHKEWNWSEIRVESACGGYRAVIHHGFKAKKECSSRVHLSWIGRLLRCLKI